MPGRYDLNMRELMKRGAPALLKELGYPNSPKYYHLEMPGPGGRAMDYVAFTKAKIFHLEFQTIPDNTMPLRMIEYCTDILRYPNPDKPRWIEYLRDDYILQTVLHFRRPANYDAPLKSKSKNETWIFHKFENKYAGDLDSEVLLDGSLSDAVFSAFGTLRGDRKHINRIIKKLESEAGDPRSYQFYMFMLSGLGAMIWKKELIEEFNRLPILAELEGNEHLLQFIQQGEKSALTRSLARRVGINRPDAVFFVNQKLSKLDLAALEEIDLQAAQVGEVNEEVLGFELPTAPAARGMSMGSGGMDPSED